MKPEHIPDRWRCQCVACHAERSRYQNLEAVAARMRKRNLNYMTTAEVSEFSGATLRQLQWWDEKGYLKASKRGHDRAYTRSQAMQATKLREMKDAGIPARKARALLRKRWTRAVRVYANQPQIVSGVLVMASR